MANTTIQLKYSLVTANPPSLNIGEPAYSYTSNTLFIGSPAGTGAIAIGGQFYLDKFQRGYDHANAAFNAANTGTQAQLAFNHANSAFDTANGSVAVNLTQNTNITNAQNTGDAAFLKANSATNSALSAFVQANAAFDKANTAATDITALQGVNLTQNASITAAQNSADAAFIRANNSLNANVGGTITGSLIVTGNLTVQGNTTFVDTEILTVEDSLIKLANNNTTDAVDIGFYGQYNDGSNKFAGLARTAGTNNFFLFKGLTNDPAGNTLATGSITAANAATLIGNVSAYQVTIGGQDIQVFATNAYTQANTATTNAATAQNKADNAFHQANAAYNLANTNATNITSLEGVNVTQNTNITAAQNKADSAFHQANAAFLLANGTAGIANTDFTNVNITSADYGSASAVASFKVAANGRIISANSTSIALSASAITSGTLSVERGGTGAGTHTVNGVLLGQGTSAFTTASSSTEGHVLTSNNSGVPTFSHLSGGTF